MYVICPEADTCIEDCDVCKEPHLKKDCMRPAIKDWDIAGCHIECVPTNKRPEKIEKVKVEHLTILYDGGKTNGEEESM